MDKQGSGTGRFRCAAILATLAAALLAGASPAAGAQTARISLGAASTYAVLAGSPSVTNSGSTRLRGDLGIHPGGLVVGFPPGKVDGDVHAADATALAAKSALAAAYEDAAARLPTAVTNGGELGGLTLGAGVYGSGGAGFALAGILTLDGAGDPNAVWIFQASSSLVTAASSSMALINGAQACNVYWQVTGSAMLGADSSFAGNILARSSITILSRVSLAGRALAQHGFVSLMNDAIAYPICLAAGPAAARAAVTEVVGPAGSPLIGALLVAIVPTPSGEPAAAMAGIGGSPVIVIAIALFLVLAAAKVVDRRRDAASREARARERSGGPEGWDYGPS